MLFNVADLLKEPYGSFREHAIDDDVRIDGETRHVSGAVRFDRTRYGILVRAALDGEGTSYCSRCLRPIRYPIRVAFEEQYVPTVDIGTGAPIEEAAADDEAYRINRRHMVDLAEPIRQYWAMAEPMAPLCADDCAGICPDCGEAARPDHDCGREPADDRWEKLRNLKLG